MEEMLDGQWTKASSNDGTISHDRSPRTLKLTALTHWALKFTEYQATILDMQGVGLTLSDLEVVTLNQR